MDQQYLTRKMRKKIIVYTNFFDLVCILVIRIYLNVRNYFSATPLEAILSVLGVIGACITGMSFPYFNIIFGHMIDAVNKNPNGFADEVEVLVYNFIALSGISVVSGLLQVCDR